MANEKISQMPAISSFATGDLLPIVDISEVSTSDQNKSVTFGELFRNVLGGTAAAPSIAFTGDQNTGIYSPGADQVAISTNGTGRLFVDASGNVGVGASASTASRLEVSRLGGAWTGSSVVAGTALTLHPGTGSTGSPANLTILAGTTSSSAIYFGDTDSSSIGVIDYIHTSDVLRFNTNGSEKLRITSDGKVGLGTSSPGVSLDVVAGSDAIAYRVRGRSSDSIGAIQFTDNGATTQYASIQTPAANTLALLTASTERLRIDSSGRVGIGTTSPNGTLNVVASSASAATPDSASVANFERAGNAGITISTANTGSSTVYFGDSDSATIGRVFYNHTNNALGFFVNNSERARIDSSGRLLVGTSTSKASALNAGGNVFQLLGSQTLARESDDANSQFIEFVKSRAAGAVVANNDILGRVLFEGSDGTNPIRAAEIQAVVDGTPGANDMPGRLVFSTTADGASSPTERMRINSAGEVWIGGTFGSPGLANTTTGTSLTGTRAYFSHPDNYSLLLNSNADSAVASIRRSGTQVGSITVTTSATAYNTSSDYRLKENVVPLIGAVDRLNQLQVHRFNFIADPSKTVDGFIAHEAQAVVPECVTGTKDEVDDEGNPVYQGIDQSKLVPLLTAALQEALAEIESLKARLTAAGI